MTLSSFPDQVRLRQIVVPGLVLVAISMLVNQLSAQGEALLIFNAVFEIVLSAFASIVLLLFYRVSRTNRFLFSRTLLWILITMVTWFIGDVIYLYKIITDVDPFISPVDVLYVAASLFFIITVLTLAGSQPPSRRRNMVFIEISILVLSATIIFTILLLTRGNPDLNFDFFTLLMVFIYPVLDVISLWLIMILFFTYPDRSNQKVLGFFFAGAIFIFFSDLFYLVYSIYSPPARFNLADTGYYVYYLMLMMGGLIGFKEIKKRANAGESNVKIFSQNNWIVFLPGVLLITMIGLLLVFAMNHSFVLFHGIVVLIIFVIVLFIIHQYLVVIDNIKLTREMRQINAQLETKVEQRTAELSKANTELQEEMKEREKAEKHLARSNQDLALLNRDKDKLFTILAHDLRSPLGSMMNLSELLVENIKAFDESELMEVVGTLNKSASQTFQLLNDLLAWSSIQMGRGEGAKEYIPVSELVSENIAILASEMARKQIEILADIDPALVVFADKFAIQTVLRNLLSNAVKFTGNHGTINVTAEQNHNFVEISVADNGIGISREKHKNLFRVGTVSSSPGTDGEKGTGFGLLLCKDLVNRNGGKIWFESEKGKGSAFHFSLPLHETSDISGHVAAENADTRIEYQTDNTLQLAFTTLYGEFDSAILKLELSRIWGCEQFNPGYSVLIDIRKASFIGESKDFPDFLNIFFALPGSKFNRKFAVLTDTPQQVAYSTMFGQFIKAKFPLSVEVFSTREGAMTWLGV